MFASEGIRSFKVVCEYMCSALDREVCGLKQCSSTFFIMVHSKKSCGELMHPMCLKLKQRQKDTLKLIRKETTVLHCRLHLE